MEMRHRHGPLALDLAFKLTAPWTILFGASGSGKTTILRTIAGFVRPQSGRVVLRGTPLLDTAQGLYLAAHTRPVRTAGQSARLFPAMTVGENLLWGQASSTLSASTIAKLLEIFRIEQLVERYPRALSGGEQQRVSVARAAASAAASGALLLLDEPFAGLDSTLRDALVLDLQAWLQERGVPVLSVTHDVGEAFLLGAEVIRLHDGRIAEQGQVQQVLRVERERLLAQLHLRDETGLADSAFKLSS